MKAIQESDISIIENIGTLFPRRVIVAKQIGVNENAQYSFDRRDK